VPTPAIIEIPISDLRPAVYNPRKISDDRREALRKVIIEYGMVQPAVVNIRTGNTVVAGHERLKVWQTLGYTTMPCIPVDLSLFKEKALNIALNAKYGEFDGPRLAEILTELTALPDLNISLTGLDHKEMEKTLKRFAAGGGQTKVNDAPARTTDAAALNLKWQVTLGDVWSVGSHRLMCGDSTKRDDVARCLAGDQPGLMVTDPPYGVEYDPKWHEKADPSKPARRTGLVTNDNRASWAAAYALSPARVAYVWHASMYAGIVQQGLESSNYMLRSEILWIKHGFVLSRSDYYWAHEACWYAVRDGETADFIGGCAQGTVWADIIDNFATFGSMDMYAARIDMETVYLFPASLTTTWKIKGDKSVPGGHSTQKPVECMARPIRNHAINGVYEPFAGSGTTLVAAENEGRRCYALEISPDYCAVILERMSDAFPGMPITKAAH
jgi:DNA modification methylase